MQRAEKEDPGHIYWHHSFFLFESNKNKTTAVDRGAFSFRDRGHLHLHMHEHLLLVYPMSLLDLHHLFLIDSATWPSPKRRRLTSTHRSKSL
jgi:hypothetical protein